MPHLNRRAIFFALCVGLAAFVGAVSTTPAFAATPKIVGTTLDVHPFQYQIARVDAKVLDKRGRAVSRATVTFAWTIDGHIVKTTAKTNSRGVAESRRNIGGATPWRLDSVALSTVLSKKKLKGIARFQPLPAISSGHPVTVRIGIAGPLSAGATALGQGMQRGALLAIAQFDASSTVAALGITFMGMHADDQGDPKVAVAAAKRLLGDPRLLGVEGHLNSGCSIPAARVYASAGVPMITPASTNPALTALGLSNVFRACASDAWQGPKGARIAYGLGHRKAYVVDDSTPYGGGLAVGFETSFEASGGTIVGSAHTSDKDTAFASLCTKIKSLHPDVIYYGGIYNAGALFSKQLHDSGVSAPVMGGDGLYDSEYVTLGGTAVNGDLTTSVGFPVDHLPNGASFISAYNASFPGVEIGPYDAYAYDATNVILSAIVAEAQVRGAAAIGLSKCKAETLKRISATNAQGATGPVTFDVHGDRMQHDIAYYKVIGGYWTFQGVQ